MRQILFIFLLTFSNNSIAEWVEYSTRTNGDVYFFDDTRVHKSANQIKVWSRIRYKTSIMGASSYQSLLKIDCSNQAETTLQSTFYSDKDWNTPAMATNMKEKPKKNINKNSATERLAKLLCCK
ncbi:MAG: surface-adhesin E family protein [Cocleimonas sp.]